MPDRQLATTGVVLRARRWQRRDPEHDRSRRRAVARPPARARGRRARPVARRHRARPRPRQRDTSAHHARSSRGRPSDLSITRLHDALRAAAEVGPREYADLLLVPGVGARTVEALALVAEVIHGAPCRFRDPARFSHAQGGKDGAPFPVPLTVYDRTIGVLEDAVARARLGQDDRLAALRELDRQARILEPIATGPSAAALFARERQRAAQLGGRTVFGAAPDVSPRKPAPAPSQLTLPGLGRSPSPRPALVRIRNRSADSSPL